MRIRKHIFLLPLTLFLLIPSLVFGEKVILKTGQTVEGSITKKTGEYIVINIAGFDSVFFNDEIERIENENSSLTETMDSGITNSAVTESKKESDNNPDIEELINTIDKYIYDKKYQEALSLAKKLVELYPNNSDYFLNLSMVYYYLGNFHEGISAFEKAIALKDLISKSRPASYNEYYISLAVMYDAAGLKEKAKKILIELIDKNSNDGNFISTYNFIAEALLKKIEK